MTQPIRILIVDDHDLFRAGLRSLLANVQDIEVIGEAGTGREAMTSVPRLNPDVVLMDILMPELNGLDATARIAAQFPSARVIMLSMYSAEEYVIQARRAGAFGYLLKNVGLAELEGAIKAVMRGETFLSSSIPKAVIERYAERTQGNKAFGGLTSRQREVLQLVAEGNKSKEIAKKLEISVKTVELHRTQLMKAVDIHDIAGLVRYAIRIGLIQAEA